MAAPARAGPCVHAGLSNLGDAGNFIGYETKLLRAQSQSSCLPQLAPYTGNFYVIGHTFSNAMCGQPSCQVGSEGCAFPFVPIDAPSRESEAIPRVQLAM